MAIVDTVLFPNVNRFPTETKIHANNELNINEAMDLLDAVKRSLTNNRDVNDTVVKFETVILHHVETQDEIRVRTVAEMQEFLKTVPIEGIHLSSQEAALLLSRLA